MSVLPTGPLPHDAAQKSPVQHHQAKSADIHNIMKKFERDGILHHVNTVKGRYADYPGEVDFHQMQNTIALAKTMFETVPPDIRSKFHNDPGEFVDFMTNEANYSEIKELGIEPDWLPEPVIAAPEPDPTPEPTPEPAT